MSIHNRLVAICAPEQGLKLRSRISFRENSAVYKATVTPPRNSVIFRIDGGIIDDATCNKCDKLILIQDSLPDAWRGYFVELKGCQISDAITQLEDTIRHPLFSHSSLVKKFARIVGRSFPSSTARPEVEQAKSRFRRLYSCDLKCLKSQQPDSI